MLAMREPVRQGPIDGLCGVYAVLNSCRLLGVTGDSRIRKDVRMDQSRRLFKALCMAPETRELFPGIVCHGTHEDGVRSLLGVAARWASRHSLVDITIEQPALTHIGGARRFFAALKAALKSEAGVRKCYLLGLGSPINHWTVVRDIRDEKVLFLDSCDFPSPGRDWAPIGDFTFDRYAPGVREGARHVIDDEASYLIAARCR